MELTELAGSLRLDKSKDLALYVQVKELLLSHVDEGRLAKGDRLPPVRQLAQMLAVNVMTIAKAYKELAELGVIRGRGALGTFVIGRASSPPLRPKPAEPVAQLGVTKEDYARRDVDTFRRMLQVNEVPGVVPLTRAYPDTSVVDMKAFEQVIRETLARRHPHTYAYISPSGLPSLRSAFSTMMRQWRDLDVDEDDIVVTGGGQQGLALIAHSLLKPGDVVLVERPTYFGALDLFRSLGVLPVGVPMHPDGLDIEALGRLAADSKPKLLFINPTFQNPTGITTSPEKRRAILEFSRRYGIAIVEDDCCPELRYRGEVIPSIKSIADDRDLVYYLTGMGKVYVPGIRLGLLVPPKPAVGDIIKRKSVLDLHTSPLCQEAFAAYATLPSVQKNITAARTVYRRLLDTVHRELTNVMPDGCEFEKPDGGLNIWVRLPRGVDAIDFYLAALQRNVGILVGEHLFADEADRRTFRLSFGYPDKARLIDGVRGLGSAASALSARTTGSFAIVV